MEVKAKERSGNSQPTAVQRQNISGDRGEEEIKSRGGSAAARFCGEDETKTK